MKTIMGFKIRLGGMTLEQARAWRPVIGRTAECPNLKLRGDWITVSRKSRRTLNTAIPNAVFVNLWYAFYRMPWTDKPDEKNPQMTQVQGTVGHVVVDGKKAELKIWKWIQKGGYGENDWHRMFYKVTPKA